MLRNFEKRLLFLILAMVVVVLAETILSPGQTISSEDRSTLKPNSVSTGNKNVSENLKKISGKVTVPVKTVVNQVPLGEISSIRRETTSTPDAEKSKPAPADPTDFVSLKNGDRLTGKILRSDGKTITIKTDYAGDVEIKWDAVDGFSSSEKLYLSLRDGQTIVGTVTSAAGGQVSVQTAETGVVTTTREAITGVRTDTGVVDKTVDTLGKVAKKTTDAVKDATKDVVDVSAGVYPYPGLLKGWQGNFDIGLALTAGNTNSINFVMGLDASRETATDRLSLYASQIYAKSSVNDETVTTANAFRGGLRYDWKFKPRWSAFVFGQAETNDIQGLDFRFSFGGGLNYRAIDTERKKLDLFAGGAFTRDYYESDFFEPPFDPDDLSKNSFELLFGDEYTWRISDRYRLKQRLEFYPNVTDFGEFRLNFDLNFSADLTRRIAWQNNFSYRWFTNPPPGFNQQDMIFTTGLRFKFGK